MQKLPKLISGLSHSQQFRNTAELTNQRTNSREIPTSSGPYKLSD